MRYSQVLSFVLCSFLILYIFKYFIFILLIICNMSRFKHNPSSPTYFWKYFATITILRSHILIISDEIGYNLHSINVFSQSMCEQLQSNKYNNNWLIPQSECLTARHQQNPEWGPASPTLPCHLQADNSRDIFLSLPFTIPNLRLNPSELYFEIQYRNWTVVKYFTNILQWSV